MCSNAVVPEAQHKLAKLLDDMRRALCPDDPESVVIGPVDFGSPPHSEHDEWCWIACPHVAPVGPIGGVSDTATSGAPDRPESDRIVADSDVRRL